MDGYDQSDPHRHANLDLHPVRPRRNPHRLRTRHHRLPRLDVRDVRAARSLPARLVEYVGPPLLDSLQQFAGLTEAEARDALTVYRASYHEHGAFDSAVFPGIRGLLSRLNEAGIPLAVATSKPELQAKRILEHFDLARHFDVIAGATEDESRSAKSEVVAEALRRLTEQGVDLAQTVMVGDRAFDVEGAAENGLPTILVEWGYGSPAEAVGAIAVVHSTDQLSSLLLG
ncbi:HAD hydrolase-like protein [Leifsonia poae]|uniref:HAD hydrolase-like protein n=1 Tax=Leifsonia poae TaxID=110933 RepID=UPI0027DFDBE8|nr:HAD hydrolase-like protein [Leifsonia poae]